MNQGKELQDELALNLYDFEWRQYDPLMGRTTTMDPHAYTYSSLSPYSWVANNPISIIDPDGQDITSNAIATSYTGVDAQNLLRQLQSASYSNNKGDPEKPTTYSMNSRTQARREQMAKQQDCAKCSQTRSIESAKEGVDEVELGYAVWSLNYDHTKYPTTKGRMKPMLKPDGRYTSLRAAQFSLMSQSVKGVGFGLSVASWGLRAYTMSQRYNNGEPINPIDKTQFGIGSVGIGASILNYLGFGGKAMSTISAGAGIFGMVLSIPSQWFNVYNGAANMEIQSLSTPYYPTDYELMEGNH